LPAAAERLTRVGGTLLVSSMPVKGSIIQATAPLSPAHRPLK
jgi:hypothetical protein